MNILEKSIIHDIIEVNPLENFKVFIKFDDGLTKIINIKPFIGKGISKELENPEYFNKVFLEGGTISWPNGYDFCPLYLRNEI